MPSSRDPIIVVEDESAIRRFVTRVLEQADFATFAYSTADQAMASLSDGSIDPGLVLSDISVPGDLDGLALAARLSMRSPSPPVVLMSGNMEVLEKARSARGVHDVLGKPFTIDELLGAVRMLAPACDR